MSYIKIGSEQRSLADVAIGRARSRRALGHYEGVKTTTAKAAWDSTDCRIPPERTLWARPDRCPSAP